MLFYVVSLTLILAVVPWNTIVPPASPFTVALAKMGIPAAGTIMSFIILTAVLSCLNSCFYICSRVLFVLAEKGDAPRWLVKTNERKVPARSVLLGAAFGFAGLYAEALFADVFTFLVNATGAIILFIYVVMAVAQVRLRRRMAAAGETPLLPMWGFPVLSYAAIVGMVAVLVAMAATPALATQFWASVVSVVVVLIGYLLRRRSTR
jgi:L-asparagine transporter-like permease